jgi:hypothetical protein
MSNKRITDLSELTTPTTDDVLPIVDIASNTTQKVQVGNLPTTTAVTNALATKQETLVSGTNIKTINSNSLLGSGDVAVQETLVSGVSLKTVNSTSLLGAGDIPIPIVNPSGVSGAIQFSDGSAFASDAANLFYDDTNNRLGVGINAPTARLHVKGSGSTTATTSILVQNSAGATLLKATDGRDLYLGSTNNYIHQGMFFQGNYYGGGNWMFGTLSDLGARLGIKGSGTTSATTALLVQNSAGNNAFEIKDDRTLSTSGGDVSLRDGSLFVASNRVVTYRQVIGFFGNPAASAIVEIQSTTMGFLPPRMTTTQKNAIATPAAGLVVYDTTLNKLCVYTTAWETITSL